ncbi:hypothetical protein A5667_27435 [Mycolicibacterium fortuitum]|uniref:hypothetical protein n=1 Tax=Mycolicibacterium fortuitum TaxID=1766 RepID=UPI0007ED98EA|nr:hypothetical protein [Mycolicibacterium fortuitum]OBI65123.1 hypothetical protein A5667_27435 [Mycolicibacterium fortuitum]
MSFWGRLWQHPFDAAIWGDVATWVGALGTSGAAIAAAAFYINDRKTTLAEHANHVEFLYDGTSGYSYLVRNNGDKRIYAQYVTYVAPRTVRDMIKSYYYPFRQPLIEGRFHAEVADEEAVFRGREDLPPTQTFDLRVTIRPDDDFRFKMPKEMQYTWGIAVVFTFKDARGTAWYIGPHTKAQKSWLGIHRAINPRPRNPIQFVSLEWIVLQKLRKMRAERPATGAKDPK